MSTIALNEREGNENSNNHRSYEGISHNIKVAIHCKLTTFVILCIPSLFTIHNLTILVPRSPRNMKLVAISFVLFSVCVAASARERVSLRRTKGDTTSPGPFRGGISPRRLPSSKGGKGKGKGGKGKGGSGNPCDICNDGKPDTLTLRYELPAANSAYQPENKASCRVYPDNPYPASATLSVAGSTTFEVISGTEFTLSGSFSASTTMSIQGWGDCTIHTSCSAPLVPGDKIGPFFVVGDEDCEIPEGECIVCDSDNKNRPEALTFIYNSEGKNSLFQSERKASCREATYPATTTLTVDTKSGEQVFMVSDGDEFTIQGEFDAETDFDISSWSGGSCYVHTSCSAPLVVGDQIGPFLLIEGNECKLAPRPCIVPDKEVYDCGEEITVSFDYANPDTTEGEEDPMVDDWIGIYPCGNTVYKHAESWLWACPAFGENYLTCPEPASTGTVTFKDPMPDYNDGGPHTFPIAPFYKDGPGSEISTCFQAVLLRNEGPSTPPYLTTCLSAPFTINVGTTGACQVRDSSPAFDVTSTP